MMLQLLRKKCLNNADFQYKSGTNFLLRTDCKFITVGAIATLMTIVFGLGMNIPFIHGTKAMIVPLVVGVISAATAFLFFMVSFTSLFFDFIDETRVMNRKVRNAFCYYRNGNPLNLKEGEKLPKFTCEKFTYTCTI